MKKTKKMKLSAQWQGAPYFFGAGPPFTPLPPSREKGRGHCSGPHIAQSKGAKRGKGGQKRKKGAKKKKKGPN